MGTVQIHTSEGLLSRAVPPDAFIGSVKGKNPFNKKLSAIGNKEHNCVLLYVSLHVSDIFCLLPQSAAVFYKFVLKHRRCHRKIYKPP